MFRKRRRILASTLRILTVGEASGKAWSRAWNMGGMGFRALSFFTSLQIGPTADAHLGHFCLSPSTELDFVKPKRYSLILEAEIKFSENHANFFEKERKVVPDEMAVQSRRVRRYTLLVTPVNDIPVRYADIQRHP